MAAAHFILNSPICTKRYFLRSAMFRFNGLQSLKTLFNTFWSPKPLACTKIRCNDVWTLPAIVHFTVINLSLRLKSYNLFLLVLFCAHILEMLARNGLMHLVALILLSLKRKWQLRPWLTAWRRHEHIWVLIYHKTKSCQHVCLKVSHNVLHCFGAIT